MIKCELDVFYRKQAAFCHLAEQVCKLIHMGEDQAVTVSCLNPMKLLLTYGVDK